jgi:hypothetical protein
MPLFAEAIASAEVSDVDRRRIVGSINAAALNIEVFADNLNRATPLRKFG